jgi:hypothetical protein
LRTIIPFKLVGGSGEGISPRDSGFIAEAIFGYSASLRLFLEKTELSDFLASYFTLVFLFGLLGNPEDRGDIFLRNVG